MSAEKSDRVVIIGAGPAGLTAACRLAEHGRAPIVLEQRARVGGIACTESYRGFLFDMGGHRFFSKDPAINAIWAALLEDDFLVRQRLSRIYYQGKFFDYPLKPASALAGMGPAEALAVMASYARWRLFPYRTEETFDRWVTNRFGKRLFRIFFKSYTEKVWGIPCFQISAAWAAQRIKDLCLRKALGKMLFNSHNHVRTLIEEFHYPRKGPSMMWDAMAAALTAAGGELRLERKVTALHREGNRITGVTVANGEEGRIAADRVISSMPITTVVERLVPAAPEEVRRAAASLRYRDFLTVCLIVKKAEVFPDQWIYVHDPDIRMGRIQNYKNWSPHMVPDAAYTGLGLEYFCQAGDDLWSMQDSDLVRLGTRELARMGLVEGGEVADGTVFRVPKAYPIYDQDYARHLRTLRAYLRGLEGFQTIGRNGLFRYNNMDHSMLSAICAVENLLGFSDGDVWKVNEDPEFIEG